LKRVPDSGEQYERLLKLKPEDARAHLEYANLIAESNPALAEEHLRRAIQLSPSPDEARLRLASLLESGSSPTAEALAESAGIYRGYLEQHPERRDLRGRLGEIYARQKQFSDAAAQFEMARAAGDSTLPVAKELLRAYLIADADKKDLQKNSGKAIALVEDILNQDGRDAEMHLLYGKLLLERKRYREAAEQYHEATALQPQSPDGYRDLASALYLLGDYQEAVGALQKVSELKQDTAGTYFLRAICLDKLHILKAALENYQKFLAVSKGENPDQEFQARHRSKTLILDIQKGLGGGR
jgi:tetratricopeptide (TPR) repeat protein